MPYLNETGLAYYNTQLKDWIAAQGVKDAPSELFNFQQTGQAGAVTLWPVGGTPLMPVVDYIFTETPPLDGNPKSPTNPSTITGVSSITITRCESVGVDETDYTIALGDTYYGGSIDLATGVMTVTYYGIVYDGTENWDGPDDHSQNGVACYSFACSLPSNLKALASNAGQNATNTFCSHFDFVINSNLATNHFYIPGSGGYPAYFTTFCTTRDDWKTWLQNQYAAGHPLTLAYKLATPFTVQLSPVQISALAQSDKYTPRLNTVYSDQESVQVGYIKSPIRNEFELQQAVTALGGNI